MPISTGRFPFNESSEHKALPEMAVIRSRCLFFRLSVYLVFVGSDVLESYDGANFSVPQNLSHIEILMTSQFASVDLFRLRPDWSPGGCPTFFHPQNPGAIALFSPFLS
jgi:hypothetical protein